MKINTKQAVCLAWIAILGSSGNLKASDAVAAAADLYASPPKAEKGGGTEPDFGITTSDKTKKAFAELRKENESLWRRDFQSTLLYRSLRREINELRRLINDTKATLTLEKCREIEKKESEILKLKLRNEELEKKVGTHAVLEAKNDQLQDSYNKLLLSLESATNRTNRSNVNFAEFLEQMKRKKTEQKNKNVDDYSDDD
ncbi:MAG: hypothetical protein NEHIOOID_01031 [Holosporales bacterium]